MRGHPTTKRALCLAGSCAMLGAGLAVLPAAAQAARSFVPHELLVGYNRGARDQVRSEFELGLHARPGAPAPEPRSVLLRLPGRESVTAAAARMRRQPGVAFAEPNYLAHTTGFIPDDPGRSGHAQGWQKLQWNYASPAGVNAPQAWANLIADHHAGGRGVVVAVLDSGVAYRNWRSFRRSPDFNRTRFVHPYDFVSHNRFPLDREGHGTFVAGMIGESTNNGYGLTGLAYGASIMPVRVLDASGIGDENTIAHGIRYAASHGARVINLSLEFLPDEVNSPHDIPEIISAINYAHRKNVVVVASAGNDEDNRLAYPARDRDVISVGATTRDRCEASYSNDGQDLDLVAPGGGSDAILPSDSACHPDRNLPSIYQLTLTSPPHWDRFGYPNYYIGTSMAAPEVSATAALIMAGGVIGRHPTPAQVLARLEQTATPLGSGHRNMFYGYGLVNAGAATMTQPHRARRPAIR